MHEMTITGMSHAADESEPPSERGAEGPGGGAGGKAGGDAGRGGGAARRTAVDRSMAY